MPIKFRAHRKQMKWLLPQYCTYGKKTIDRKTIFAVSTPPGISAIAIIRISGPNTSSVLFKMAKLNKLPEPRKATLCCISDPENGDLLDKGLLLWFPSPNSFTGEDLCELHVHGGVAVIRSVLYALAKLPDFDHAEPGEFTRRAFFAKKLDLTEIEGLADLLNAETEAQQKQALRQMEGFLYEFYNAWTEKIKKSLAKIEAYIDFSEDQHLGDSLLDEVTKDISELRSEIHKHLCDKHRGEKLRQGLFAALVGRPNVGKSSLLNALCRRDVAIVSSTAGTTRDIIDTSLNIGGYLVNICDMAGIRETDDVIEAEGVKRAKMRFSSSDIRIVILEARRALSIIKNCDSLKPNISDYLVRKDLGKDFYKHIETMQEDDSDDTCKTVLLLNKVDLLDGDELQEIKSLEASNRSICAVSCTMGTGMDAFLKHFTDKVQEIYSCHAGEESVITQERHRRYVEACYRNLQEYEEWLDCDISIAASKLHNAANEVGKITGKVTTDEILDVIFRDFCIGK